MSALGRHSFFLVLHATTTHKRVTCHSFLGYLRQMSIRKGIYNSTDWRHQIEFRTPSHAECSARSSQL